MIDIPLDAPCVVKTEKPDTILGPMILADAVRQVIEDRQMAASVRIYLSSAGIVLEEEQIRSLYADAFEFSMALEDASQLSSIPAVARSRRSLGYH